VDMNLQKPEQYPAEIHYVLNVKHHYVDQNKKKPQYCMQIKF
jgi:hypothetical protein